MLALTAGPQWTVTPIQRADETAQESLNGIQLG